MFPPSDVSAGVNSLPAAGRSVRRSPRWRCASNPGSAFNSYWEMPFRKGARFTLENRSAQRITIYDQITYTVQPVEEDAGCFHAQFRRVNPLPYKQNYTILDGVFRARGQYVGTYMAWGANNSRLVGRRGRDQVLHG